MNSELTKPLTMTVSDLTPREPMVKAKDPVDMDLIQEMRAVYAGSFKGEITKDTAIKIKNALEKGASFEMASMYAGLTPGTFKRYIEDGMYEVSQYTQEDFDNGKELSFRAQFALMCMESKAKAVVELTTDFYDRCKESGKEHLAMWMIERLDPNFHLKKKVEQDTNVDIGGHAVVEFKFVSPQSYRPKEELKEFDDVLVELKDKWKGDE